MKSFIPVLGSGIKFVGNSHILEIRELKEMVEIPH